MRFIVTAVSLATVVLATGTGAHAFQKELAAYDAATLHICEQGVTPQIQAKYDALVTALEEAKYGYGRSGSPSNFWGPMTPQMLFDQCRQSGGDGEGSGGGSTD
jgi:hypothetical protein